MTALDIDGLIATLDSYQRTLFRFEQLPAYYVDDDGDDYHRWMRGEHEPTWERKQPWLDVLRADRAAGRDRRRVRVFSHDMTGYERYACHWGYALNGPAGEDIRVLHHGEHPLPADLPAVDFWTVDNDRAVVMNYDSRGDFLDATLVADPTRFLAARDRAWAVAEPFDQWWSRHPEMHEREATVSA